MPFQQQEVTCPQKYIQSETRAQLIVGTSDLSVQGPMYVHCYTYVYEQHWCLAHKHAVCSSRTSDGRQIAPDLLSCLFSVMGSVATGINTINNVILFQHQLTITDVCLYKMFPLVESSLMYFPQHTASVEFLLKNGARPNIQNEFGDTPLHSAAWKGVSV